MATPIRWQPPSNTPKWSPPQDPLGLDAGIESDVDAFGRASTPTPASPAMPTTRAPQISGGQALALLDEELQRNLDEANAAMDAEEARRPTGPNEVIAGQMEGSLGAYGGAFQNFLRFQPRRGARANPDRPFVEQRVAERTEQDPARAAAAYEQAIPFQPEPYLPLPRHEDETEEEYAARNELFAEMDFRQQREAYDRKKEEWLSTGGRDLATLDTRAIGRTPGAIGMEEAQRQGQENIDSAREEQDRELAREQAIAAGKQADATLTVAQQQKEQRAREEAGMAAVKQLQSVRRQAREALVAMPQASREQVAKGLSKGTKIAAVLGAMAQGWMGNPITAVNDAIDRAVGEQMDLYTRRKSEYQDVIDEADDATGMLDFITNSVGGNREASAALLREMHIEDTIADIQAKEAATNVPIQKAMYKQLRVALESQLREETMAMELQLAKTPEMLGFTIDSPFARLMREETRATMKEAREEQMDLRKDFRGEASKVAADERQLGLESVKQQGAVAAKRAEKDAEAAKDIKIKSAAFGAVEQQIDDLLSNTGNIHGRGMAWTGESDQRITTDSQLTALKQALTQAFTGATATEDQQEAFARLVEGDWSELSDDSLRARLRALKNIVSAQRRYLQKELPSSDRQITNPRELSTFKPR